jgi:hypothetical protein
MVGAGLVSSRLKGWRRVQGWKIGRRGGRYRWGCYLFRLRKRKDIFMKTNMTGDINTIKL